MSAARAARTGRLDDVKKVLTGRGPTAGLQLIAGRPVVRGDIRESLRAAPDPVGHGRVPLVRSARIGAEELAGACWLRASVPPTVHWGTECSGGRTIGCGC